VPDFLPADIANDDHVDMSEVRLRSTEECSLITYRLTEADIVAGNTLWRKYHSNDVAIAVVLLAVWAIISVCLGKFLLWSTVEAAVGGLIIGASVLSGILLVGHYASRRTALHYFRTGPESGRGEISVEWSADHVTFRQGESTNKLKWSDFRNWSEDKTLLVLLGTGPIFYAMPKRAFTAEELRDFHSHRQTAGVDAAKLSVLTF
jgi:hypothetical protein